MDTSETYIKMCKQAEEVQAHEIKCGDYLLAKWGLAIEEPYISIYTANSNDPRRYSNPVWLPRQDQLQEMAFTNIDGTYNKLPTKVFAFSDYWEENGIPIIFNSLEQLWLAFAMKENYQKIWDGENWVKEK